MSFTPGAAVYARDAAHGWLQAEVKSCAAGKVLLTSGAQVPEKDVCSFSAAAAGGVEDMIKLDVLHEASILHNLKTRQQNDEFYTKVGSILVCLNPYKPLHIYTPAHIAKYAAASPLDPLPPHIFGVAKAAYEQMQRTLQSQSIVISGESGAGKTETTKLVLKYLTAVSAGSSGSAGVTQGGRRSSARAMSPLETAILQSNPVLEAFGNAKTVRNNNSSRFGKYFDVGFNMKGEICGGSITNYLLEKSRVVTVAENERNYHVFYQICAGMSDGEKGRYSLKTAKDYLYLSGGVYEAPGIDDTDEYSDMLGGMVAVGITEEEQDAIFRMLAAILNMGNARFKEDGDGSALQEDAYTKAVSDCLMVGEDLVRDAFTQRTMSTGAGGRRGSVYKIPLKVNEALDARDALAKALYTRMFNWLVIKISEKMEEIKPQYTIGVLDIFGFEIMPINSFEQLCINFANEKLHAQFIDFVFKLEMAEYEAEGMDIKVDYVDNTPCVQMIERPHTGMLAMLQEQIQLGNRGSDDAWLQRMNQDLNKKEKFYIAQLRSRTEFGVQHYANPVVYDSTGFLEKNKDVLNQDIVDVLDSLDPIAKAIVTKGNTNVVTGKKVATIASQFSSQLQSLVKVISSTAPHYVRCIKPTESKQPGVLDGEMCARQLGYSGVLEILKVRIAGYAVRLGYEEFAGRFRILMVNMQLSEDAKKGREGAAKLVQANNIADSEVKFGKSKIFLKSESTLLLLEQKREQAAMGYVVKIQKCYRRHCAMVLLASLKEQAAKRRAEEEARKLREEQLRRGSTERAAGAAAAPASAGGDSGPAAGGAVDGVPTSASTHRTGKVPSRKLPLLFEPVVKREMYGPGGKEEISDEPASIKGFMSKEPSSSTAGMMGMMTGGRLNAWQKRFFVLKMARNLKGADLSYYTDSDMREIKGTITLNSDSCVADVPPEQQRGLPTGIGSHFFQIESGDREMKVAVESADMKQKWMQTIGLAVKQMLKAEGKLSTSDDTDGEPGLLHFPDTSKLTIYINDRISAKDVFLKVAQHVGLLERGKSRGLQFFSLVEETNDGDGVFSQRVLSERDSISNLTGDHRLLFKKVVYVGTKERDSDDPLLLNFLFVQAVNDHLSYGHPSQEEAFELGALQLLNRRGGIDLNNPPDLKAEGLHEYLPYHMFVRDDAASHYDEWEQQLLATARTIAEEGLSLYQLQRRYVDLCQHSPIYGSAYYAVTMSKDDGGLQDFVLAVNRIGLHLVDRDEREIIATFPYEHIVKWGRSAHSFNFITQGDNQWTFETYQGDEINKFMGIYVRLLLESRDKEATS